jgi:hypothetical protein
LSIIRAPRPETKFYILDKSISEDKRLGWAARGFLIYLLGKPDHWKVSIQALVNETSDSSEKSARDRTYSIINQLIDAGYITRTQGKGDGGKFAAYDYVVSEAPLTALPYTDSPDTVKPHPVKPTQVSNDLQQGTEESANTDKNPLADKPADAFAKFWAVYPNKKAKGSAEKVWAKLKPDHQLAETIISAVQKHKLSVDWTKDDGQFIPHPATWLNAKRWEDEVTPAPVVIGHQQVQTKHGGFDQRDYSAGLTAREGGGYAF